MTASNGNVGAAVNMILSALGASKDGGDGNGDGSGGEEEEPEKEALPDIDTSIVRLYGENRHTCGYCKSKENTNVSYGMLAVKMLVEDYEELMAAGTRLAQSCTVETSHKGWRRSGTYCYKLNNRETCCPTHTIRLDVTRFHPSKEHKAVLKRAHPAPVMRLAVVCDADLGVL